jgi:hypothetical protein
VRSHDLIAFLASGRGAYTKGQDIAANGGQMKGL